MVETCADNAADIDWDSKGRMNDEMRSSTGTLKQNTNLNGLLLE